MIEYPGPETDGDAEDQRVRRMFRQIKVPLIPLPLLLLLLAVLVPDSDAKVAEGHLKTREVCKA